MNSTRLKQFLPLIFVIMGIVALVGATTILDPNYVYTTGPVNGTAGYFTGPVTGTTGTFSGAVSGTALTGTTLDTGQGANELYDMNQNVLTTSTVTFVTVDTGQGANELYDMNQNVDTSSSPTFSSISVTGITLSGDTRNVWPDVGLLPGATAYFGMDFNKSGYTNYFYCDGDEDQVEIQNAINYCAAIEDSYTIMGEIGVYEINGTITFSANDRVIFKGVGKPKSTYLAPLTTGGTVLNFYDDAQLTADTGAGIAFWDMGFYCQGTYTDSWIDLIDNNVVDSYDCMYMADAIVPNGNAGNPSSTLSGNVINIGKVSGPPGVHYHWEKNVFVDQREGAASASTFLCFVVEHGEFIGNSFFPYPAKTLNNPNFMFVNPVSSFKFSYNIWYLQGGWTAAPSGQYYNMYMSSGGSKNLQFEHDQFLDPAQIENAHFYTNSGSMYVSGTFPHKVEGGTSPVDLSVGGAGTVYITFSGRGYEVSGSATILNGNTNVNVTISLVGTPTYVECTGTTTDSTNLYVETITLSSTNIQIFAADGAVGGDRTIYYKAIYSKSG